MSSASFDWNCDELHRLLPAASNPSAFGGPLVVVSPGQVTPPTSITSLNSTSIAITKKESAGANYFTTHPSSAVITCPQATFTSSNNMPSSKSRLDIVSSTRHDYLTQSPISSKPSVLMSCCASLNPEPVISMSTICKRPRLIAQLKPELPATTAYSSSSSLPTHPAPPGHCSSVSNSAPKHPIPQTIAQAQVRQSLCTFPLSSRPDEELQYQQTTGKSLDRSYQLKHNHQKQLILSDLNQGSVGFTSQLSKGPYKMPGRSKTHQMSTRPASEVAALVSLHAKEQSNQARLDLRLLEERRVCFNFLLALFAPFYCVCLVTFSILRHTFRR
ncbi:unnamed protein product [Protopolystoma xenopodis]|uniref:Uncharacterized protein n=1 Tax=Protopolystoma xenopodis TaxID=117903 RepID=A0A3S5BX04_9PLAT|nr:unnamed protein product [Protopolystoma xenopodis]